MLATERAALGFVQELTEPANLSLRWPLRHFILKELGGTGSAMIVRAHMAGPAQGNEVIEGIVAGESEGIHVMNVEFSTILISAHAACAANSITRAYLGFDCFPITSVVEGTPTTPITVPFAMQIPGVICSRRATARAIFPPSSLVGGNQDGRATLLT